MLPSNSPRAPPSARARGAWVCKPDRDSGLPFVSGVPGAARVVVADCRADAGVGGRREALAVPPGGSCSTLKQLAGSQKQMAEVPRVSAMPGTPRGGERRTKPCFCQMVNTSHVASFATHVCNYLVPRAFGRVPCYERPWGARSASLLCCDTREGHDALRTGLADHAQRTRSGRNPPDTSSHSSRRADLGVRSARCQTLYAPGLPPVLNAPKDART